MENSTPPLGTPSPQQSPGTPKENFAPSTPSQELNKTERFKRSFFQIMIGCLIGAAGIAVIAVLFGEFSETLARALGTIGVVALHSALGFGFIERSEKKDKKDGGRSIELFSNAVFVLIIVSFITSVFGIWGLFSAELAWRLYLLYIVLLFATLHADVLYRIRGFEAKIDNVVMANYFFMAVVVLQLAMIIFAPDVSDLGEYFYRMLAAAGIVDATLTITALILHKLYLQKHPELIPKAEVGAAHKSFWRHPLVVIVLIYLAFQIIGSFIMLVLRGLNSY